MATEPEVRSYRCTECGQQPRLEKRDYIGLVVTCGCDRAQSIKTNSTLPGEWSA